MPHRSTCSKKLTPATVADSDDDFVAIASESDEPYIVFFVLLSLLDLYFILSSVDGKDAESDIVQETDDDEDVQVQGRGHGKNSTKVPTKNKAIEVHDLDSEDT